MNVLAELPRSWANAPQPHSLRKPLRVLHVYRTYFPEPPGGIAEAIRQICLATRPLGVESTVFCLSPRPQPDRLEDKNTVTWRSRSWATVASCNLGGPDAWRRFASLARSHDVIHYHFPWPFADLLHLTVRPKAKTVLTYHSDIVRQSILARPYEPLMWRMLCDMDSIVATSPAYAQTSPVLRDRRIADRVRVIPLGMQDLSQRVRQFPKAGAGSPPPYFLFVGALRYYKGLSTLIEAARHVEAKILIAGDGPEGPSLMRRARELKLTNVEFLGQISEEEKIRLLAGCRALLLPSHVRSEAFGMVLVEAAIFGRPMVTCEIGSGTTYVNVHDQTGLVVEPENPAALAGAVNRLLNDEKLARRLGEGARARYEALFSQHKLGTDHNTLYQQVLTAQALPAAEPIVAHA